MSRDVMFDLETLATTADAVILSIGAVVAENGEEIATYHDHLNLDEQLKPHTPFTRKVSQNTLLWWLTEPTQHVRDEQSAAIRELPLHQAALNFQQWCEKHISNETLVWGNGADFDLAILMHFFSQHSLQVPWKFWNHRCFRTLKNEHKNVPKPFENLHNALSDAWNQMAHLHDIREYQESIRALAA